MQFPFEYNYSFFEIDKKKSKATGFAIRVVLFNRTISDESLRTFSTTVVGFFRCDTDDFMVGA
jgi:hypothetical protein